MGPAEVPTLEPLDDVQTLPPPTVFYSWQADLPANVCRNLIQDALERGVKQLRGECELVMDPRVDRDTKGEPGSPDIVQTIERKIECSIAFVGDVSLVARNVDAAMREKLLPNASVATETGFALSSLGERRVVLIINTVFGEPDALPFDLRNRRVLKYALAPRSADETDEAWQQRRRPVRATLVEDLVDALRSVFDASQESPPPTVLMRHAEMSAQLTTLRQQVGPRTLSEQQIQILREHAVRARGGVALVSRAFDGEAERFAEQLETVFRGAGWQVVISKMLVRPLVGLAIAVSNPAAPPGYARVLQEALEGAGLPFTMLSHADIANQTGLNLDAQTALATLLLVGQK